MNDGGPGYDPQNSSMSGERTGLAANQPAARAGTDTYAANNPGWYGNDYYNDNPSWSGSGYHNNNPGWFGGGYYNYSPGWSAPPAAMDQSAMASCQARFRSFDPATSTYLGFDGVRHSCP